MIPIKTSAEIAVMRDACRIAAQVLEEMALRVAEGVSTYELDQVGRATMERLGAESACYQYKVGRNVFPAFTCISINDEIVHGIPTQSRIIQSGDIVSLDVVIRYKGFVGDNARTILVEPVADEVKALCKTTEEALYVGIAQARSGNRVHDISHAIERHVRFGNYGIVEQFVGHGVGRRMHEEPQIPNLGRPGTGALLRPGMTLAIEPMINLGTGNLRMAKDGWTALTQDGKASAHFEHTVLITEGDPEILTTVK